MHEIDINCDLGESYGIWTMGDDAAMLEVASSANIACGFHAGDPVGILKTLKMAAARQVAVGAHVGYRDLAGFGRRSLAVSSEELFSEVVYQVGALKALAEAVGTRVAYVKPHGALYNTIAFDARQAADVISAIQAVDPALPLMALAGSPLVAQARAAGLNVVAEAFADRAYRADGQLVSRLEEGAVLHDPELVAQRMIRLVRNGIIDSIDGKPVRIGAQSICVHGDSKDAVAMARCIRLRLQEAGLVIRSFTKRITTA